MDEEEWIFFSGETNSGIY